MSNLVSLIKSNVKEEYSLGEIVLEEGESSKQVICGYISKTNEKYKFEEIYISSASGNIYTKYPYIRKYTLPDGTIHKGMVTYKNIVSFQKKFGMPLTYLQGEAMRDFFSDKTHEISLLEPLDISRWNPEVVERMKQLPDYIKELLNVS
ncbi:MAG: hypothetical protein WC916_02270 [Candidatus Woesearchaeota archaeon]